MMNWYCKNCLVENSPARSTCWKCKEPKIKIAVKGEDVEKNNNYEITENDIAINTHPKITEAKRVGKLKSFLGRGFGFILAIYFFSSFTIAVPWFNWQYAKENGFFQWLFLGEIVATGKALVWPYFILKSSDEPKDEWENNTRALAITIMGSWSSIQNVHISEDLPELIKFGKEWIKHLPDKQKHELRDASEAFKNAWLAYGDEITNTPEKTFDAVVFESPTIQVHVNEFKKISGFRNTWDAAIQNYPIEMQDLRKKFESLENKEEFCSVLRKTFKINNQQGKTRMEDVIHRIFDEQ